ncbi:hypothetical protein NicSoilE8_32700 [Arthrobacter sp. NicSoilE8]|nr:hypothetical protein NicSoilE8_32700 [Arthrobacter sp. NicSoilE8]
MRRGIVGCGGAPIADTAYMGLTSCLVLTIMGMLALPGWERGVGVGREHHIEPTVHKYIPRGEVFISQPQKSLNVFT